MIRYRRAVLGGIAVIVSAVAVFLYRNTTERSSARIDRSARDVEAAQPTQAAAVVDSRPLPHRENLRVAQAPAPPLVAALPGSTPECTADAECNGPRHAECVAIKCVRGKCVYDDRTCECVRAEDCDDGDPCTRNHCFSSTMKCIFIPIDDCKK